MCDKAVCREPYALLYVPDHFITEEMCEEVMHCRPVEFFLIPDRFKAQEICIKTVEVDPWQLEHIRDHLKTQKMCYKAVRDYLFSMQPVPDWFVTQQQIDIWYDDDEYYNDNVMIKWYNGYKKKQSPKSKNKRRTPGYCFALESCEGLVHVRRQEGVVEVTNSCFKNYLIRNHYYRAYLDPAWPWEVK